MPRHPNSADMNLANALPYNPAEDHTRGGPSRPPRVRRYLGDRSALADERANGYPSFSSGGYWNPARAVRTRPAQSWRNCGLSVSMSHE
jgi:hypothetical protein